MYLQIIHRMSSNKEFEEREWKRLWSNVKTQAEGHSLASKYYEMKSKYMFTYPLKGFAMLGLGSLMLGLGSLMLGLGSLVELGLLKLKIHIILW
jgi:hypothetical protein